MTKLSDVLRGAADRAPVADAVVSVEATARRVQRHRGLRSAANGTVGLGAVALLAVGIIAPGVMNGRNDVAGESMADFGEGDGLVGATEDRAMAPYGYCGSPAYEYPPGEEPDGFDVLVNGATLSDVTANPGDALDLMVTAELGDASWGATNVFVVWDSMVVGTALVAPGDGATVTGTIDLVNCWDGQELPGGSYTLVVAQEVVTGGGQLEPIMPLPKSSPFPDDEPIAPDRPMTDGGGVDSSPREDVLYYSTVVSRSAKLTVTGDVPEDPFGQYQPKPVEITLPEDYLSPALARELFEAGVTSEPWNMAAGTHRWIMRSEIESRDNGDAWAMNYFGCSWDGVTGVGFPARSAELDLIDVDIRTPRNVNLSYGWIVDGNPLVTATVRNESDYTVPGLYGAHTSLYLVRDGRVVAEGYPVQTTNYGGIELANPSLSSTQLLALNMGLLAPDTEVSGEFLWRDVNGCWTESGPLTVSPGEYTLLASHTVYITSGQEYAYWNQGGAVDGDSGWARGEKAEAETPAAVPNSGFIDQGLSIMPVENYDWVELQRWTSLGTLTVTAR